MTGSIEPPLLAALKNKMQWHSARQGVLAENVANASTPGFRAQDLAPLPAQESGIGVALTNRGHLTLASASASGRAEERGSFERTPDGNAVVLEEQMTKAAQNQMDHQMAATLYGKSLGLLRIAIGKR
ncbi:flagellar basal body protein [Methylopila turkensis]|uniref:Flagellar basal body rod protein FlgB n=1 Tax=Methylopila turkensis TaxID=1437816 RepID=A0A9W6JLP1_9HYPH|nr:flagellar basal body rod protein FlgB [Methylopila turkensis]